MLSNLLINASQLHTFQADLRYSGQAINIPVDVELYSLRTHGLSYLHELFEAEHGKLFTYRLSSDVELVNLRVIAEEVKTDLPIEKLDRATSVRPPDSSISSKTNLIFQGKEYTDSPIWDRLSLKHGHAVVGPCIISEMDSNTVVLPGFRAEVDAVGNILIDREGDKQASESSTTGELDVVTVDIFENALRNARNEMDTLMTRTTMSPAIREQQDEFNVIAEPTGKMIVGQMGSFIREILDVWKDTIESGDIFLTNDPYSVSGAVSHHNDWLILLPIHVNEKLSKSCGYYLSHMKANARPSCLDSKFWAHDGCRWQRSWISSMRS